MATADEKVCVASRRIRIEDSRYLDRSGETLGFDTIVRSPATSIQAISDATGLRGFRIQMKFSPRPESGIYLTVGGTRRDIAATLEPSKDSLWITGDSADRLATALAAGEMPELEATSRDTGHLVSDRIDAPDLDGLSACATSLADEHETAEPSNQIRLSFVGDPKTTPLATLPELQACRMTDAPGELHLARIRSNEGFYAQSDKVFVSFDEKGAISQIYVPGIFDGDFRDGKTAVRVSKASDANLPTEPNRVSGCLGMAAMQMCQYMREGGNHVIAPCIPNDVVSSVIDTPESWLPVSSTPIPPYRTAGTPPRTGSTPIPPRTPVVPVVPTTTTTSTTPIPPPPPVTPVTPVPVPPTVFLLGTAVAGLFWRRRRRV